MIGGDVCLERNSYLEMLEKAKKLLQKNLSFITVGFIGKRIVSIIIILITSTFAYLSGYLFLWGYYFGGEKDQSLLSVAVNLVPIDHVVAFSVGFFYIILIVIILLLFIVIFVEKLTWHSGISIIIVLGLTNLAIVYFLADNVSFENYGKTLGVWLLPILFIFMGAYYYVWAKSPRVAMLAFLYCLAIYINIIFILRYLEILTLEEFWIPLIFVLMVIFGVPFAFLLKIRCNSKILKWLRIFFDSFSWFPLVSLIIYIKTQNIWITLVCIVFILCIYKLISVKFVVSRKKQIIIERKGSGNKEINQKPLTLFLCIIAMFFILSHVFLNALIKGGDYMYSIIQPNNHQKIEYKWDGQTEFVKGSVISSKNDIYYISNMDRKLLILKVKDVKINSD